MEKEVGMILISMSTTFAISVRYMVAQEIILATA